MTPEERQLISSLFDRMRSHGAPEKERERLRWMGLEALGKELMEKVESTSKQE